MKGSIPGGFPVVARSFAYELVPCRWEGKVELGWSRTGAAGTEMPSPGFGYA